MLKGQTGAQQGLMHTPYNSPSLKMVMVVAEPETASPGKALLASTSHRTSRAWVVTAPSSNNARLSFVSALYLKVHTVPLVEEINTSNHQLSPPSNFSALRLARSPVPVCELTTLHRAAPAAFSKMPSIFLAPLSRRKMLSLGEMLFPNQVKLTLPKEKAIVCLFRKGSHHLQVSQPDPYEPTWHPTHTP